MESLVWILAVHGCWLTPVCLGLLYLCVEEWSPSLNYQWIKDNVLERTKNWVGIPWLHTQRAAHCGHSQSELRHTEFVCLCIHVKNIPTLHLNEAYLNGVVDPAVDLWPEAFNCVILQWNNLNLLYVLDYVKRIALQFKPTNLEVVCRCGGLDVSFLRCANFSCTNSVRTHSLPWSTRTWSHMPYSRSNGLWCV